MSDFQSHFAGMNSEIDRTFDIPKKAKAGCDYLATDAKLPLVMSQENPNFISVPVIGGHAGTTIPPLFSQYKAGKTIDAKKIPDLDKKVQDAGTAVVDAKNGKGRATLSMACARARLGKAVLAGLSAKTLKEKGHFSEAML